MACDKKVVVITGAIGGIGIEIVKKFYNNDYYVVLVDINLDRMNDTVKANGFDENRVACFALDISKEDQVEKLIADVVAKTGRIDALVNTAGICGKYAPVIDYGYENFKRVYEVNVYGTFLMMAKTLPVMVEQKKGAIVNFGSCSGMRGYSLEIGYGSSKWAVIGMTQNVATEYGEYGIRCNSVSPGWVNTAMMRQTLADYDENGKEQVRFGAMPRPGEPSEMADAVYYLASDEASYITGANLVVDGGKTII